MTVRQRVSNIKILTDFLCNDNQFCGEGAMSMGEYFRVQICILDEKQNVLLYKPLPWLVVSYWCAVPEKEWERERGRGVREGRGGGCERDRRRRTGR